MKRNKKYFVYNNDHFQGLRSFMREQNGSWFGEGRTTSSCNAFLERDPKWISFRIEANGIVNVIHLLTNENEENVQEQFKNTMNRPAKSQKEKSIGFNDRVYCTISSEELKSMISDTRFNTEPIIEDLKDTDFLSSSTYNARIRKISDKRMVGCYVLFNRESQEILYIGMAGQVTQNGDQVDHGVTERLQRQRTIQGEKVSTYEWLSKGMEAKQYEGISIAIMPAKNAVLPGFLEGYYMQKYFRITGKLPAWNNKF